MNTDGLEKRIMAKVVAVAKKAEAGMPKHVVEEINIIENWGVEGDYHAGTTVRHRYLARKDPTRPNKRQVNLLHSELFPQLRRREELSRSFRTRQKDDRML